METPLMTSGAYFKSVKIVHFALLAGIVFFALTSIFLHQNGYKTFGEDLDGPFLIIVHPRSCWNIYEQFPVQEKNKRNR